MAFCITMVSLLMTLVMNKFTSIAFQPTNALNVIFSVTISNGLTHYYM